MVVIEKEGYFENGAWTKGLHRSMIGKKIVRTRACNLGRYLDYSYSAVGKYFFRDDEYVTLMDIRHDGALHVKHTHLAEPHWLGPVWNDGKWVEYTKENIETLRNDPIVTYQEYYPEPPRRDPFDIDYMEDCEQ